MAFFPRANRLLPRRQGQRGSAITEFAIVAPCLVLALFGTVGLGTMLGRYIQATTVCRDLAHMYSDGVDFTQSGPQNVAVQLAQGTGMTATGGNGVVIFSQVMTVYQADCDAAGFTSSCNSLGQCVFIQRITVGNPSMPGSAFGTPNPNLLDPSGNISPSVYLQNTDSSVIANGLSAQLIAAGETNLIPQGNTVWITEVYFTYPDISFLGNSTAGGAYARFIF